MKVGRYQLANNLESLRSDTRPIIDAWHVTIGDQGLIYVANKKWDKVSAQALRIGLHIEEYPEYVKKQELHLVIQKGRLFQQAFPNVPVLLDKGRYLVIVLSRDEAVKIQEQLEPCFTVRPLKANTTVLDIVPPPSRNQRRTPLMWIKDLVDKVSKPSFEATLMHLASYHTRLSTSDDYHSSAIWVREQLNLMGYSTAIEPVAILGQGQQSYNIYGEKKGISSESRDIVVVTAHLDSVNHEDGPLGSAPGADDNGSGSAGLLEIARVFRDHKTQQDLRFIFFGGEEQGLIGSKQYVTNLSTAERSRIIAIINMDMIGILNTTPASVLLEGAPISQSIIDGLKEAAHTYSTLQVEISLQPWGSDHVPFIDAGMPAVLTIEGSDQVNINEHSARDKIDHIDMDFALEIVRMNTAFLSQQLGS